MAKHEWVRAALDNWARWLEQSQRGGLGYPRQAALARLMPASTCSDTMHVPVDDLQARRLHDAIESMRFSRPELWLVIHLQWVGDPRQPAHLRGGALSVSETARTMNKAASTVYAYVSQAVEILAVKLRAGSFTH